MKGALLFSHLRSMDSDRIITSADKTAVDYYMGSDHCYTCTGNRMPGVVNRVPAGPDLETDGCSRIIL